jgi:alpha-tubulin suppressor-like RCC1 family protein
MARRGQGPDGGGGEAADRVVSAAVGRGCVYALTEKGDVFQWGAAAGGGGGARGAAAAPARVPGVKGARSVVASAAGRFAAAVDDAGRLFTWGTGARFRGRGPGHVRLQEAGFSIS